ncbi:MAG TPA: hypothetical protein VFC73_04700 [Syntrophomonadaceae bacterium]|nr:hypothetical protein [Syntrophomonadaceae bacterium]
MKKRNQYLIVIAIIVLVYSFGFYIAKNQEPLEVTYPNEDAILDNEDFMINFPDGKLAVGLSDWFEVENVLPEGKMLGMSTVYSPKDIDCLLSFTKKENILYKLHLENTDIITNRNIKTGDPFSKVIDAYGPNYSSVSKKGNKNNFDATYGADNNNNIVFQVRNNVVNKIILQSNPILK